MENQHPLRLLWSGRWWILLAVLAAAVVAYFVSERLPDRYRAEALTQIVPRAQAAGQPLTTDQLLQATNFYAEVAKTTPVQARAERLVQAPRGSFDNGVDVEARPDLLVLAFSSVAESAPLAARRANAYARAFSAFVGDQQSQVRREALREPQQRVSDLERQLRDLSAGDPREGALTSELQVLQARLADEALTPTDTVRVIQPALTPRSPDEPKPVRNAVLAAIAALVLASSLLLLRAALSDRYESIEEAALDLRLPVLGELPKGKPETSASVEAFRKLRTRLVHALEVNVGGTAVLITSPEDRTGKSHVTTGLALALAADGSGVVAVDADLRRPALHERFGVPAGPGLGEVLDTQDPLPLSATMHMATLADAARERGGELTVVPAGRPMHDSAEALSGPRMSGLIQGLLADADVVLLDSPPVLAIADAAVMSREVGAVLMVVDLKRSRRRAMRRAVQALRGIDAPLLGLVQNRATLHGGGYGYYSVAGPNDRAERADRDRGRLVT